MTDPAIAADSPDNIRVARWFGLFAIYMAALCIPAAIMLADLGRPWQELFNDPGMFTENWQQVLKVLIFTAYLSLCCTFLPMPTGPLVAAVATHDVALAPSLAGTVLLVATAGGIGSMMANLNDYHLFTLALRSRRIATVRQTRACRYGTKWFDKAPFVILMVFNIIPIPVDVVRMLAATRRYPRPAFAAASFLGRFVRYGLLAGVAFATDISKFWAAMIMLGIGAALAGGRGFATLLGKRRNRPAQPIPAPEATERPFTESLEPRRPRG